MKKTTDSPIVAMMMAMDRNRLIGRNGTMPWHIPGEQAYFKSVTLGKPIIMGRKTFDSIGRPLPGRTNIVVTRNTQWQAEGVIATTSLDEAIRAGRDTAGDPATAADEMVVIGGAGLCRVAMPITQRLYLTFINHEYEGDTWLDSYEPEDWVVVSDKAQDTDVNGGLDVRFQVLERRQSAG